MEGVFGSPVSCEEMDFEMEEKQQEEAFESLADSHAKENSRENELEILKIRFQELEKKTSELRAYRQTLFDKMSVKREKEARKSDEMKKTEADSRSVYVGNVGYSVTADDIRNCFESCGTVLRVTVKSDKNGNPKGYAYIEFAEAEAVQNALRLANTLLRGKCLIVKRKRTNVPGMKRKFLSFSYRGYYYLSIAHGYGHGGSLRKYFKYRRAPTYLPY